MANVLVITAVVFYLAALSVGTDIIKVKGEWTSVAVTYGLLATGATFFGWALTL